MAITNKSELMEKFKVVFLGALASKDAEDVEITLSMFKKAFCLLAECDSKSAQELLDCYEGTIKYCNYLSENESEEILSNFVNQDGSKGSKWRDPEDFFNKVDEMGGKVECEPHYNKWALYTTANKFFSDQHNVIQKWTDGDKDKYFEACYELAVSQLKDKDCPCWVRWYFGIGDK